MMTLSSSGILGSRAPKRIGPFCTESAGQNLKAGGQNHRRDYTMNITCKNLEVPGTGRTLTGLHAAFDGRKVRS
jgi:hypothetical protein